MSDESNFSLLLPLMVGVKETSQRRLGVGAANSEA